VSYFLQAFNSLLRSFSDSSNLYFQVPAAVDLSLLLTLFELTWNQSTRAKV